MDFMCWAVFIGGEEEPVYIWDADALQLFVMACVVNGLSVEIFGVKR